MRLLRWAVLLAVVPLVGCDVAAAAFLLGKGNGSGGSGGAAPASPSLSLAVFKVWVASIPSPGDAGNERSNLVNAKGNPSGPTWTEVGNASLTTVFGPLATPSSFNAILVQASSDQNYLLDSIEILDGQDQVVEFASGQPWSDQVDFPERMLGGPDGASAVTNAVGDVRAFIFTLYSGPIQKFRINGQGQGQPPAPGDVAGSGSLPPSGSTPQVPGGIAADPVGGLVDVVVGLGSQVFLARFDSDGTNVDQTLVASGVPASGSDSVAIDSNGVRFVAATVGSGQVLVRRFETDLSPGWSVTFDSGFGGDRVESNGIAVDSSGNVVVGGGRNSLLTGVSHWMARLSNGGNVLWNQSADSDASGPTYWRGVATNASGLIFASGDLGTSLVGGAKEVRTARYSPSGGSPQWSNEYPGSDAPSDLGQAVAVDPWGNIVVVGYLATATQGKNGVLLRYSGDGAFSSVLTHNGPANGDDEILDVAIDEEGSMYAVGYETVAGQGENMWIRKYAYNGATVWTRTHHGGFGDDRAVSVAILGSKVAVAGYETNSGGQRKLVMRLYAR